MPATLWVGPANDDKLLSVQAFRFQPCTAIELVARLPLLVPEGSVLPLTKEGHDFSRLHDEPSRCVRIFPGRQAGTSSFTLYEDDGLSLSHREGDFAALDFGLDWDDRAVRLRLIRRGGYALPYQSITVAIPGTERRQLLLESSPGASHLVAGNWRIHSGDH
jgi:alpha-glucosidase